MTTSDNEWQRMTKSDNERQRVTKKYTVSDSDWQRVRKWMNTNKKVSKIDWIKFWNETKGQCSSEELYSATKIIYKYGKNLDIFNTRKTIGFKSLQLNCSGISQVI